MTMTKKSKKSKSPLEAAVTTARKIWGTRKYDPAAPLVPPTTGYIDPSHAIMALITSDVDKAALATADGIDPMTKEEVDDWVGAKYMKGLKHVGIYSVPMLLEALTYMKGVGCDIVTLKNMDVDTPLTLVGDMDHGRVLTFIISPRTEDNNDGFGDDDEDDKESEKP